MNEVFHAVVDGREREYREVMANGIPIVVGYGANLAYADLMGVDLAGLDLSFANLRGADLTFADLSGCNLSFADLSDANAIGANLQGATLRGAVTRDASLTFADLRGATYERSVRGAFINDDLTPEYLASLGISSVDDAKESGASLLPVEGLDETNPKPKPKPKPEPEPEPEMRTDVAPSEFGVEDEGEFVEQLVSGSPLADLLTDAMPGSVAASSRSSLPRSGRSRDYSELLESLSEGIAELVTSERWTAYLDAQSKFHSYSFNNTMLILLQRPDATRVAGYRKWKELGRQVMRQEKGLRILAPMTYTKDDGPEGEKTSEIHGFKMVPVFDISQTEGQDLPEIARKLQGMAPSGVFDRLTEFANTIGFRVERPESLDSGANGDCSHVSGLIRVVSSNSEAQQAKTLAHEISHALLHDPQSPATKDLTRGLKELEAESAAYVICTALGMDTSDYSFGYVATWAGGGPEAIVGVKESAGRIQKASTAVLKTFEVEESIVEGVDVRSPQLVAEVAVDAERDPTRDHGDPRVGDPTGSVQVQAREVEDPDERGQENSVELLARDVPANSYRPLSGEELDVLGVDLDVSLEI